MQIDCWLSLIRRWTWRWTSRWEGMTKVNWSLELAVEEEKRRWRRLLATPGPSLVTASQLRTPSLHVAASPPFEIFPSAIVVILSSDSLGSQDINSVRKALDYSTCTIFIGGPSYKYNWQNKIHQKRFWSLRFHFIFVKIILWFCHLWDAHKKEDRTTMTNSRVGLLQQASGVRMLIVISSMKIGQKDNGLQKPWGGGVGNAINFITIIQRWWLSSFFILRLSKYSF